GESWRVANQEVALAALYLDVGRVAEAATLAKSAVGLHRSANVDTTASETMRARTLVAAGQLAEARALVDAVLARPSAGDDQLTVQMAATELELAEGHGEAALARLRRALADATPPAAARFAAELLLARAERAVGRNAAGRKRLAAVTAEARSKGFALVARHAAELQ
ncbi:MAG TPA: hypothetical protein VGH63_11960, partial [Polyangia bacterium]